MAPIRKHIVTDDSHKPVAIQLSMADWLRIEPILKERGLLSEESTSTTEINQLLQATVGIWSRGDGLTYQQSVRSEWPDANIQNPESDT